MNAIGSALRSSVDDILRAAKAGARTTDDLPLNLVDDAAKVKPPNVAQLKNAKVTIRLDSTKSIDDQLVRIGGKDTKLTVRQLDELANGNVVKGVAPDIKGLHKALNLKVTDDVAAYADDVARSFKGTKNFKAMKNINKGRQYGKSYSVQYGDDVDGLVKYANENEVAFKKIIQGIDNNPGLASRLKLDKKALTKLLAGGAGAAAAIVLLHGAVENLRKEKNGCLLIGKSNDNTTGPRKIRLLTCDDSLLELGNLGEGGTVVETCDTVPVTSTSAAPPDCAPKFNPCIKSVTVDEKGVPTLNGKAATRRSDLPESLEVKLVPDVCESYLYRKVKPTNPHSNNKILDSCAGSAKDAPCSNFCRKDFFAADVTVECVNLKWGEAFWALAAEAVGDAVDTIATGLGVAASPFLGSIKTYLTYLVVIGGGVFVLYLGWKYLIASMISPKAQTPAVYTVQAPQSPAVPAPPPAYPTAAYPTAAYPTGYPGFAP
jgi:hypothetical protein